MKRIIFKIIAGVSVTGILFLGLIYVVYANNLLAGMSKDLVASANRSLEQGVQVDDPKADFSKISGKEPDGRPNNEKAYDLPFCDIKSVSVGMDEKYFYYKINFWDLIPRKAPTFGSDKILNCGSKLNLTDSKGVEKAILDTNYTYELGVPAIGTYYFYGATGIKEPEDKRYSGKGSDSKITGGFGYDYLIAAFPLKKLNMKKGDLIYLNVQIEAESKIYHHAAMDVLGGSGKAGAMIIWDSLASKLQVDNAFFSSYSEK